MKNQNLSSSSSSMITPQGRKRSNEKSTIVSIQSSQQMKLFENQLKGIYWVEIALTKAIPKMIRKATFEELIDALIRHFVKTKNQVTKVEQVFQSIDKKAISKKCKAMVGLIKETEEIMDSCEAGAMCDAGIISAFKKIVHYEIATFGTLRQHAKTLCLKESETLFLAILKEEKKADEKLSEIAQTIHIEGSEKD